MLKVMIDAGHGVETAGKRSPDGMREFEFNHAVAKAMKKELLTYNDVTVYFAHDEKRDVPLTERTTKANTLQVDLYFSIHANALNGTVGQHGGIETYVYPTKPKEAYRLAEKVQQALIEATSLRNRGVKIANFHVLRETNMTAILVEHGFMDSSSDLPKLKSPSFRTLCGQVNARTVATFYQLKRKQSPSGSGAKKLEDKNEMIYKVQVGAFAKRENASRLAEELQEKGYETYVITEKR